MRDHGGDIRCGELAHTRSLPASLRFALLDEPPVDDAIVDGLERSFLRRRQKRDRDSDLSRLRQKKVLLMCCILDEYQDDSSHRHTNHTMVARNPNIHRDRNRVLQKIRSMKDNIFIRHYRLHREDFYVLLDLVSRH